MSEAVDSGSGSVLTFTDDSFGQDIESGLALVDFWAPWCGPCRFVAPIIDELAEEYEGKVRIGALNVDDNLKTAEKFRVMSIPTVILFKDGQAVEVLIGAQQKSAYKARIDKHLN